MFIFEKNYIPFEINGKKIEYSLWNTKMEKNFLIATENKEKSEITIQDIYELLVKPSLKDSDILLTDNEMKVLILEMRKKSIAPDFSIKYTCTKCENINAQDIIIDDIVKYKPHNFKPITIDSNGTEITINFTSMVSEKLLKRVNESKNIVEKNFNNLLIHIKDVKVGDELHNVFTFDELTTFMESLPSKIFNDIYNKFLEMTDSLEIYSECECSFCKEKNIINLGDITSFLWV